MESVDCCVADAIVVRDLAKTYRVAQKPKTGIWPAVKSLFRRTYKTNHAVDGISFTIQPGEIVAFLGPNGAGKTTTLKMLSGLIYPTAGTASVLGMYKPDVEVRALVSSRRDDRR